MNQFRYVARTVEATDQLGQRLAETLPTGSVVALIGTLGAGKTTLVQSVAAALGVPRDAVTSPTFVLINEYPSDRTPIYHIDAYRLRDEDEFRELGPEEYFDGAGITFVEWADRVADCLPADYLTIKIAVLGPSEREYVVTASSSAVEPLLQQLMRLVTE